MATRGNHEEPVNHSGFRRNIDAVKDLETAVAWTLIYPVLDK
jgi:hypothetical protein